MKIRSKNAFQFFGFLIFLSIISCSKITPISKKSPEMTQESVSPKFLERMESSKAELAAGKPLQAIEILDKVTDDSIEEIDRAYKYNLKGVIQFSLGKYADAERSFEIAERIGHSNEELRNHIRLNRSGTALRGENFQKALNIWLSIDRQFLPTEETNKYYHLATILGDKLGRVDLQILGLCHKVQGLQIEELRQRKEGKVLNDLFNKLTRDEKMRFLTSFNDDFTMTPIGYLALSEFDLAKIEGREEDANRIKKWLDEKFGNNNDIQVLVHDSNSVAPAGFDPRAIGIILPFNKEKKTFSDKALEGITFALKELYFTSKTDLQGDAEIKLHIEDDQDNPVTGAFAVRKLAEKNNVAFIVGGLFPEEAIAEYKEAKKYQIPFISLSPIYLPIADKDEFLVEVPGSLNAQLLALKNSGLLEKFGRNVGVLYPNDLKGRFSAQTIWELAPTLGLNIRRVQMFNKDEVDLREPVQKFLGMFHKRARSEELDIWKDINARRKDGGRKKYAELPPVVDFNWVFMPVFPQQAETIVPLMSYFDADSLHFFGDASWYSAKLARKNSRLGVLHFSGPYLGEKHKEFVQKFQEEYGKTPKLIETLGHESVKSFGRALLTSRASNREDFLSYLRSIPFVEGVSGDYVLSEGKWNKNLETFKIVREEITPLGVSENPTTKEKSGTF